MKILAVDPGRQGGFAVIEDECLTDHGELSIHPEKIGLDVLRKHNDCDVFVFEKMHSMPGFKNGFGIGSKANWMRGFTTGFLMSWADAHRFQRVMMPHCKNWQKVILDGVIGENTKQQSVRAAAYFYPAAVLKTRAGRVLDGVADAINIAVWAQRIILSERTI